MEKSSISKRSEAVKRWRKRSKNKIVCGFGGKCGVCGYDKTTNALELHHINPEEKEFGFGAIRANARNWDAIVTEAKKCIMVCSNCHREIHDDLVPEEQINNAPRFDESQCNKVSLRVLAYYCKCGSVKNHNSKYCSNVCHTKNEASFLDKIEMDGQKFKSVCETMNLREMSVFFGVSVTTIKNWKKKLKDMME